MHSRKSGGLYTQVYINLIAGLLALEYSPFLSLTLPVCTVLRGTSPCSLKSENWEASWILGRCSTSTHVARIQNVAHIKHLDLVLFSWSFCDSCLEHVEVATNSCTFNTIAVPGNAHRRELVLERMMVAVGVEYPLWRSLPLTLQV